MMACSCGKILVARQSPHKETNHHRAAYHRVECPPVCPAGPADDSERAVASRPCSPRGDRVATGDTDLPASQPAPGRHRRAARHVPAHRLRTVKALTELVTLALDGYLVTSEEVVPNCDLCPGRNSSALLELEGPPRAVLGQARAHLDECPGLGYLRRSPGVGLRSLPELDPRCRRPGRFRPARGPRPRRMGRRQGLHR